MSTISQHRSVRSTSPSSVIRGVLVAAAIVTAAGSAGAQTVENLGVLPGGTSSQGGPVSALGFSGVAISFSPSGDRSFRWTRGRGVEDIGIMPGGSSTWATDISGNGDVVVGLAFMSGAPIRAFRWSRSRGMEDLGTLPGAIYGAEAYGVNFDGSAISGTGNVADTFHAFRWTRYTGMQDLGTLPGGTYTFGTNISASGEAVTGLGGTADSEHAFVWRRGVMRDLGTLIPGDFSGATAVSADGSVVTGYSGSNAVVWTNGVVQDLGVLTGGSYSVGYSVSGDGDTVGGMADTADGATVATLWTASGGLVDLNAYLPTQGVDLTGWRLEVTIGLSADGTTLSGAGSFNGEQRAWVVRLPRRFGWGRLGRIFHNGRHSAVCPMRRFGPLLRRVARP